MRREYVWRLARRALPLGNRTAVMGILNVTPDSFSDGGLYFDPEKAIARGKQLEQEGADLVDVGGDSTRPGSQAISEEEEMRRVVPVIESLVRALSVPVSIDTYRANVASRALEAGAQIVNDISGFRFDQGLPLVVKKSCAGVVLMHSRGSRETLHRQSRMDDPIREVTEGLAASARNAREADIPSDAIVIDPGIGFGKTADESLRVDRSNSIGVTDAGVLLIPTFDLDRGAGHRHCGGHHLSASRLHQGNSRRPNGYGTCADCCFLLLCPLDCIGNRFMDANKHPSLFRICHHRHFSA